MADRSELSYKGKGKQPELSLVARARSYAWKATTAPFRLTLSLVGASVRPVASQLIPATVFFLFIPLLLAPALFSGVYVWSHAPIGWTESLYLQYGDGLPPYAEVPLKDISPMHPYDISLHLLVPATESNYALGNFMASLTLTGASNRTLLDIRRPAIVLPPSSFTWTRRSTAMLSIHFLSAYATGASNVKARVEVGRRDGWRSLGPGEGRELSVLSASLQGVVLHRGLRGLVSKHPLIASFIATTTFLLVSFSVLAACLLPAFRWQYYDEDEFPLSPVKSEPDLVKKQSQEVLGEKRTRRRRSFKRSGSQGRDPDVPLSNVPPAESTSTPLRRRRSRLSERLSDSD